VYRVTATLLTAFLILIGLIQATSFDYIKIAGIKPDALIVVTIFIALSCSRKDTVKAAITAGLIKDITSSAVLASSMLSLLALGLFINFHQNKFYKQRLSAQIGLSFISYIFIGAAVSAFNAAAYKQAYPFYQIINVTAMGAVYTAAIAPFMFFISSKALKIKLEYV
jgi:rod shape-determining protein MreD